jgi:hypothetical protein
MVDLPTIVNESKKHSCKNFFVESRFFIFVALLPGRNEFYRLSIEHPFRMR